MELNTMCYDKNILYNNVIIFYLSSQQTKKIKNKSDILKYRKQTSRKVYFKNNLYYVLEKNYNILKKYNSLFFGLIKKNNFPISEIFVFRNITDNIIETRFHFPFECKNNIRDNTGDKLIQKVVVNPNDCIFINNCKKIKNISEKNFCYSIFVCPGKLEFVEKHNNILTFLHIPIRTTKNTKDLIIKKN